MSQNVRHVTKVRYMSPDLSQVSPLAPPHFSTLSHKWHYFGNKLLNTKYVFWVSLQLQSERFLILTRIQRDIFVSVETFPSKGLVILVGF